MGTVLQNVDKVKIIGVIITEGSRWNTHASSNICTNANRTFGFLRRNLYLCPQDVKEVRPVLEYGSSVWDPQGVVLQVELENVQKRTAKLITGNYNYETGSMTAFLGQLKWESLRKAGKAIDSSYYTKN